MLNDFLNTFNKLLNDQETGLPYPEEPPDYTLTITREQLLQQFFTKYSIPEIHRGFWRMVTIIIDKTLSYPAGMSSETKTLFLRPEYANPGIVAHEFSHLSYAQLNDTQKASFREEYNKALLTDALLRLLYSQKPYMKTNIVEAHAEIFRYIGNKMPGQLNKYYPKLIEPL